MKSNPPQRTRYLILFEIQFAARYNELNARFFRNMRTTTGVLSLVIGSGAFLAYINAAGPVWSSVGAIVAVSLGAWTVIANPADRIQQFHERCRKFMELISRAPSMSDEQLDAALHELRAVSLPTAIETLKRPAMNDVLRDLEHDDLTRPLTWWEKVVSFLA